MNSPTLALSRRRADLSLNCVIRLASPNPVRQLSTQASCGVLGHVALDEQRAALGSTPAASSCAHATRVRCAQLLRVLRRR